MSRDWHEVQGASGGELEDGNGNVIWPYEFGPNTYGLHTTVDGKRMSVRVWSVEHANETLDKLATGWRPVNW